MAHPQMCAHVKDPISICKCNGTSQCRERVGITTDGMETRKQCAQVTKTKKARKKPLGSAIPCLFAYPWGERWGGGSPNFPCIALGQHSYLI